MVRFLRPVAAAFLALQFLAALTGGARAQLPGYQQATSLSVATPLPSIPNGVSAALVCAETQGVRWRDDGVAPTATVGQPLAAGQCQQFTRELAALQFIQQTSGAILNVSYYSAGGAGTPSGGGSSSGGGSVTIKDGAGNGPVAVKPASTPSVATDPAEVVDIRPGCGACTPLGPATPASSLPVVGAGFTFTNINTATTTTPKSGAGVLHAVCVNTINATSTLQMYDNTAASGTKIGLLTQATGQQPGCLVFDVAFNTGLTLVSTTGTPDYTVSWR